MLPVLNKVVLPSVIRRPSYRSGAALLFLTVLFAACNEVDPKIVNSGASRPFSFPVFYAKPVYDDPVVVVLGDDHIATAPGSGEDFYSREYSPESEILALDTTEYLFTADVIGGENLQPTCKELQQLHRRVVDWPWVTDMNWVERGSNNFAVYLAEKAYLRLLVNYCIGHINFYNTQVVESTHGGVYHLSSDNLEITNGVAAGYNFFLGQGAKGLLFSLNQNSGDTTKRFYERMNYISDTKRYTDMRLLVDSSYSDNSQLPDFYHLESYALERHTDPTADAEYHLIKLRAERYAKDASGDHYQVVIHAELIAHKTYGTYIPAAKSCIRLKIDSSDDLIRGDCREETYADQRQGEQVFFSRDAAEHKWFNSGGREQTERSIRNQDSYKVRCGLVEKYKVLEEMADPLWFDFSSDKLDEIFHGNPAQILPDNPPDPGETQSNCRYFNLL